MLYFITGNAGKFTEIAAIVPGLHQLKLDLDEIQSLDPKVVIEHKLKQAAAQHDGEFIVEDTSLSLDVPARDSRAPLSSGSRMRWASTG
jgi:inosine/xanthosine triphosphate pyrophosphatase family protein